jgi:hypothetical protein
VSGGTHKTFYWENEKFEKRKKEKRSQGNFPRKKSPLHFRVIAQLVTHREKKRISFCVCMCMMFLWIIVHEVPDVNSRHFN